jgi:hypothetical protein
VRKPCQAQPAQDPPLDSSAIPPEPVPSIDRRRRLDRATSPGNPSSQLDRHTQADSAIVTRSQNDPQVNPGQPRMPWLATVRFHKHFTVHRRPTHQLRHAQRGGHPISHGPRPQEPGNGSHSCAATGPGPDPGWTASLMRVILGQASSGNQIRETRQQHRPQNLTRRHLPDQPGCSCNPGTPALIQRRSSPYNEPPSPP